jgi:hypothetical protein
MAFWGAVARAVTPFPEVNMSAGAIIALVIVIVVIAVAAAIAGTMVLRSLAVRRQFGPEYQRLVREVGARRARAELADRQRRVARLGIRPLTAEEYARYDGEWTAAQERFVDNPPQAAEAAAALVYTVAADRGYKVDDHAQLLKDLSVHHARRLDGYRRAAQVTDQAEAAPTEELRQALLAHRALFRELLGTPERVAVRPLVAAGAIVPGSTGRALPVSTPAANPRTVGTRVGRPAASVAAKTSKG